MTELEIHELNDDELFQLSLVRGGKYNCYTADVLKAQKEYNNRKGNTIMSRNSLLPGKCDRSYYSDRYY